MSLEQKSSSALGQPPLRAKASAENRSYALITPSYYADFERCRLLVESTRQFLAESVQHYIVIDRLDQALFAPLASGRTHLLVKEDILPWWLVQLPFARRFWLSAKSLPVRGWIVQQLVKLSVNLAMPEDTFIFVDSGVFFVKPFDPNTRLRNGLMPLFREAREPISPKIHSRLHEFIYRAGGLTRSADWQTNAAQILDVKGNPPMTGSYVDSLVTWNRDTLAELQRHIEKVHNKPWIEVLCRELFLSEYVLYGVFCEYVLGIEEAGHYADPTLVVRSHWNEVELSESELIQIRDTLEPYEAAVMINERAGVPPALIRKVFFDMPARGGH